MAKWTLTDLAETHTFAINPYDKDGPAGEVDDELSVGDSFIDGNSGSPMLTIQQQKATTAKFQVTILDKAEYQALWAWFDKEDVLTLTDDLGRTSNIYMTEIAAERTHKSSNVWFHKLTVTYLVIP